MFPLNSARTLAALAVGATVATAAACGGSGSGYGDDAPTAPSAPAPTSPPPSTTAAPTVQATPQLAFTPREVAVGTGGTVTWAFGSVAHNVTFGTPSGASGEYGATGGSAGGSASNVPTTSNASVSRTFSAAGSYPYECTIHPGMTGTVTVR